MNRSERYDALIIGGGTVGAAAAAALAARGMDVALIDRARPESMDEDAALDLRVVALSPGSRRLLDALGAWDRVRPERVAAYTEMQVVAGSGDVRFRSSEHGLPTLGWIVEIAELDRALWMELDRRRRLQAITPAEVERIDLDADEVRVELADGRTLTGRMLIGADGARSRVRDAAGIEVTAHHYNQRAVVSHLDTSRKNPGTAWQRFTDLGPMALLPLPAGRSSLVWSVPDDVAERLLRVDEDEFLAELTEHAKETPFGEFESADRRHALPLVRRQSKPLATRRVALLGDAARSVHPLAGQGLNLGLGDVAALVDALGRRTVGDDPGAALSRYARRRYSDSTLVAGGIHAINELRAFGEPGRLALGAGFRALARLRPARDVFVQRASGLEEVRPAARLLEER
jgi:2-octaprenyl-3-methyl-6-methoxy-1,4-benzoquinol hydroxylase/2-octaprenylphenol hydroxylase